MSSISGCTSREIVLETSWVYAVMQQRPQSIAVITPEENPHLLQSGHHSSSEFHLCFRRFRGRLLMLIHLFHLPAYKEQKGTAKCRLLNYVAEPL